MLNICALKTTGGPRFITRNDYFEAHNPLQNINLSVFVLSEQEGAQASRLGGTEALFPATPKASLHKTIGIFGKYLILWGLGILDRISLGKQYNLILIL